MGHQLPRGRRRRFSRHVYRHSHAAPLPRGEISALQRRLALLGLLGVAGFNLLFYSSLAYVTAAVFVVLESPATQLLETALTRRRPGSLVAVAGAYLNLEP